MSSEALRRWRLKLERFLEAEAIETDAGVRFRLEVEIADARAKIAGIEANELLAPSEEPGWPVIRVRHPLQPAPKFFGRDNYLDDLRRWWQDSSSAVAIQVIRAIGGSGKTAFVDRFLHWLRAESDSLALYVWSFYENVDCQELLTDVEQWERRVGYRVPRLIVLDGVERIQASGACAHVRGALLEIARDVRVFLRRIASGEATCRVLITSRFPLVDLEQWPNTCHEIPLEHLSIEDAVALLESLGVRAERDLLESIARESGGHALTTAVWGTYIVNYHGGYPSEQMSLDLEEAAGEDRSTFALKRVLLEHAKAMSGRERVAMCTLARDGWLGAEDSPVVLRKLSRLGLIHHYELIDNVTIHPALRDFFAEIDGVPEDELDGVVHRATLDLRERPGRDRGTCECGEPAMIESACCLCCGEAMQLYGDEELVESEPGRHVLAREGRKGEHVYLTCEECEECEECERESGSEFEAMCSGCAYRQAKIEAE